MQIDYGAVDRFVSDRGYGFVSRVFGNISKPVEKKVIRGREDHETPEQVFFHISVLQSGLPEVAVSLQRSEEHSTHSFWYVTESTEKGLRVNQALRPDVAAEKIRGERDVYRNRLMAVWTRWELGGQGVPSTLQSITKQILVTPQRLEEWKLEVKDEVVRKKRRNEFSGEELEEFVALVREVRGMNFTYSAQVSKYIVEKRLGKKYQSISGWLKMENNDSSWTFKGGFPPKIFAILCEELQLVDKGSRARPTDFTSFKEKPM